MSESSAAPLSENEALGYTLWAVFRRDPHHPAPIGDLAPLKIVQETPFTDGERASINGGLAQKLFGL